LAANIYTHSLAFDTNVFKRVTRVGNELLFEQLFKDLNARVNPKNEFDGFRSTITPFLLLEYLGQIPPNINIPEPTDTEFKEWGQRAPEKVFHAAGGVYRGETVLQETSLVGKNAENLKYVSKAAMKLYEDIVCRIVKKTGFANFLIHNLALDYTYRFPFRRYCDEDALVRIHLNAMLDIYRAHKEKVNLTQMRGVIALCEDLERRHKPEEMTENTKRMFSATKGVKQFRDLADLDLIQLACLGAFIDNQQFPVLILTSDPKGDVTNRICLFKSTFEVFDIEVSGSPLMKNSSLARVSLMPGRIGFVDPSDCSITEIIDVKDVAVAD
jgi:hypothetical protein